MGKEIGIDEQGEFTVPLPGADIHVLAVTPNYWGRGKDTSSAKLALLKAAGHSNWKTHVKGNGNKWMIVWITQPKGLSKPYVNEVGGICAAEQANICSRYFKYRGHSVVPAEEG